MAKLDLTLKDLEKLFPKDFTPAQTARAKTLFLEELSIQAHRFFGGKIMTVPKAGLWGFNWFNVWYTPGVSRVSRAIRDSHDASFELSNRGNLVAVVSDSTRVLGDGDCSPSGGLGVMEGKAFLMKYLGGVDAAALCIDSRGKDGKPDADRIIEFVRMAEPSFGAVNLEDISQPNCFKVLDTLREQCDIPVWHDDAQGTGCVTLAGLLNALKVTGKSLKEARLVFFGAGASNTTIARLILLSGGDPGKVVLFDSRGGLHRKRDDIQADPRFYRKWELCQSTNPDAIDDMETATKGADALISLSTPGPDVIKPEWIRHMARKAIVFACANPVPEIYPYAAKEAGAAVVATGRGDFPNQVNNSLGFPGILKGALLVRAKKITDEMAIAAARSLAGFAEKRGLKPDRIMPTMEETDLFAREAADVALEAVRNKVARNVMDWKTVHDRALADIRQARRTMKLLQEEKIIAAPDRKMLRDALEKAVRAAR
jgi:malate dehydrogenase (oxaloacetate-decarboxylating)